MYGTLSELLTRLIDIVQNHSDRIKTLEEGEAAENSDDADLMEDLTSLLAKFQTPESGFAAESIPSDQM